MVERMKLVHVQGTLPHLDEFLGACCLDGRFGLEPAADYMSASLGYAPMNEEDPYTPLVQRVEGQIALDSAARYNAWHFPSAKVVRRYRKEGYIWHDTPHSGQISVTFSQHHWQIRRLREQILPRWYHQWFGAPVDNG